MKHYLEGVKDGNDDKRDDTGGASPATDNAGKPDRAHLDELKRQKNLLLRKVEEAKKIFGQASDKYFVTMDALEKEIRNVSNMITSEIQAQAAEREREHAKQEIPYEQELVRRMENLARMLREDNINPGRSTVSKALIISQLEDLIKFSKTGQDPAEEEDKHA